MKKEFNEELTIILPLPGGLLSPNCTVGSIGGRFAKAGAIKKYRRLAKKAVEDAQIDTAPWDLVRVNAIFFFKQKRRRDPDNANGSLKSAYDGIKDSGLVIDDDYEHMKRGEPQFLYDREFPRVELTIEKL
ncbi:hypothetical protein LCGC14_1931400 [marine sediment metagenome]|uniref:Uncharacterized protein n=1 Tax=marine sediment metagenome TaxID=412755 RepID=A0A0F9FMY3_9ZZZZ